MTYIGSNSTLGAGEIYVSETKRTESQDHIRGVVNASKDGILWVEQCSDPLVTTDPDNAVWDYSHAVDTVASAAATSTPNDSSDNQGFIFDVLVLAPYWRIRFKANSNSGTTDLRVNARLTTEGR